MALSREDLLGVAFLLWAGAGLLALFLLGNPQADALWAQWGATRPWGMVLILAALGLLLACRHPLAWVPFLGALPMVLLPPPQVAWAAPAALLGGTVGAAVAVWSRHKRREDRRQERIGRFGGYPLGQPRDLGRPRPACGGAAGAAHRPARRNARPWAHLHGATAGRGRGRLPGTALYGRWRVGPRWPRRLRCARDEPQGWLDRSVERG